MVVPQNRRNDARKGLISRDLLMLGVGGIIGGVIAGLIANGGDMPTGCLMNLPTEPLPTTASSTVQDGSHSSSKSLPKSLPAGFGPIYSYFGKLDHLTNEIPTSWWLETSPQHKDNKKGSWFSQHGQDVAVAKFFDFKKDGFFVDLAANDAVWASNTFTLEQNFGWTGICIEANPTYWYRLSFRNCHVVGGIVGGSNNIDVQVVLGEAHQGPYGGIVGDEFDNKKAGKKKGKEPDKRYTVSLLTILEMFNAPKVIDYLSLDVEGAETFIMRDFPFHRYRFKCMTVERPKDELLALLETNGYKKVLDFKRGDTLWAHESVYEEGKKRTEINPQEIHDHRMDKSPIPGFS